jgi:hypothetical protein
MIKWSENFQSGTTTYSKQYHKNKTQVIFSCSMNTQFIGDNPVLIDENKVQGQQFVLKQMMWHT